MNCNNKKCKFWDDGDFENCSGEGVRKDGHLCSDFVAEGEVFTKEQVKAAISQFLVYAEDEFGKSQLGYFSGDGWAARCLKWYLSELENE